MTEYIRVRMLAYAVEHGQRIVPLRPAREASLKQLALSADRRFAASSLILRDRVRMLAYAVEHGQRIVPLRPAREASLKQLALSADRRFAASSLILRDRIRM